MNTITKIFAGAAVVASLLMCSTNYSQAGPFGQRRAAAAAANVEELTDQNEAALIGNSKMPVVIDFYATWCGPCKRLAPNIEALGKAYKGQVKVLKCDAEKNPTLAAKYGINCYPIVVTIKGKTATKYIGYQSLNELKAIADQLVKP